VYLQARAPEQHCPLAGIDVMDATAGQDAARGSHAALGKKDAGNPEIA
jgi:hypothetical protein